MTYITISIAAMIVSSIIAIISIYIGFMCYFLRNTQSTEQTPFARVFPFGTHLTDESTEAMRIKCLAHGHNILMQPAYPETDLLTTCASKL